MGRGRPAGSGIGLRLKLEVSQVSGLEALQLTGLMRSEDFQVAEMEQSEI